MKKRPAHLSGATSVTFNGVPAQFKRRAGDGFFSRIAHFLADPRLNCSGARIFGGER